MRKHVTACEHEAGKSSSQRNSGEPKTPSFCSSQHSCPLQ